MVQQHPNVMAHYQGVILEIIKEYGIELPTAPVVHIVPAETDFGTVVRHTSWYVGGGRDTRPHYRYRRYQEVMGYVRSSGRRATLVDLGCGAGLFSWVFIDWATQNRVGFHRTLLYGLDHCPAMIKLAGLVKFKLSRIIGGYPEAHYFQDVDSLLIQLSRNHRADTDYYIALGHVLAQAHEPDVLREFTRVVEHITGLLDPYANCVLIGVDAQQWTDSFAYGWRELLDGLQQLQIRFYEKNVPKTFINDAARAKCAVFRPVELGGPIINDVDNLPF